MTYVILLLNFLKIKPPNYFFLDYVLEITFALMPFEITDKQNGVIGLHKYNRQVPAVFRKLTPVLLDHSKPEKTDMAICACFSLTRLMPAHMCSQLIVTNESCTGRWRLSTFTKYYCLVILNILLLYLKFTSVCFKIIWNNNNSFGDNKWQLVLC